MSINMIFIGSFVGSFLGASIGLLFAGWVVNHSDWFDR